MVDSQLSICADPKKLRYLCETFYEQYLNENESLTVATRIQFFRDQGSKIQSHLVYQTTNELSYTSELPACGKFLLIAAYLASYNSAVTDKRFFSKFQGDKQRKKGRQASAFVKEDKLMAGPKKFTFERLYQIYHAILELNKDAGTEIANEEMKMASPTNQLFQQFRTFVSTKLILAANSAVSFSPYSSSAKYCISDFITEKCVQNLAESLRLELDQILEKNVIKG